MPHVSGQKGGVLVSDGPNPADLCADDMSGPPSRAAENIEEDVICVHKEKDFIAFLSSTPGRFSALFFRTNGLVSSFNYY